MPPPLGFLMLPRRGLDLCRSPGDIAALVWLCREADLMDPDGWAAPIEASTTDLCRASGLGRGWAGPFLRRLERASVLRITRAGDHHTAREVVVERPAKVIHYSARYSERYSERYDTPTNGVVGKSDSLPDTLPHTLAPSMYLETETETETKTHSCHRSRGDVPPWRLAWDRVYEIIRSEIAPAVGKKPGKLVPTKGIGLSLKARISDHGEEAIVTMIRWYATSGDRRAVYLREHGYWLSTLLRASKCEEYIDLAVNGGVTVEGENTEGVAVQPPVRITTRRERK